MRAKLTPVRWSPPSCERRAPVTSDFGFQGWEKVPCAASACSRRTRCGYGAGVALIARFEPQSVHPVNTRLRTNSPPRGVSTTTSVCKGSEADIRYLASWVTASQRERSVDGRRPVHGRSPIAVTWHPAQSRRGQGKWSEADLQTHGPWDQGARNGHLVGRRVSVLGDECRTNWAIRAWHSSGSRLSTLAAMADVSAGLETHRTEHSHPGTAHRASRSSHCCESVELWEPSRPSGPEVSRLPARPWDNH